MANRKNLVHVSFIFSANFMTYNIKGVTVYMVEGASLPVNGEVSKEEFYTLLDDIKEKEIQKGTKYKSASAKTRREYKEPREKTYHERQLDDLAEVHKACAKIKKTDYIMTRSEYEYNYFGNW